MSIQKLKNLVAFSEKNNMSLVKVSISDAKKIIREYEASLVREDEKSSEKIDLNNVVISGGKF